MELIISIGIITLAALGGLYALGLIIVALIGPPTSNDEYLEDCDCKTCSCDIYPDFDACSSECDDDCAANEHYPGQDWRK